MVSVQKKKLPNLREKRTMQRAPSVLDQIYDQTYCGFFTQPIKIVESSAMNGIMTELLM